MRRAPLRNHHHIPLFAFVMMLLPLIGFSQESRKNRKPAASTGEKVIRIAHLPPKPKDVIEALLRSSDISLSVDPSCNAVGTDASDRTVGRYISGFLSEQSTPKGKNWIDIATEPSKSASGERVWRCRVIIRHEDGDDRWGWGVQFDVDERNGTVIKSSFRCLGAG
jgi:hypothetical protein